MSPEGQGFQILLLIFMGTFCNPNVQAYLKHTHTHTHKV